MWECYDIHGPTRGRQLFHHPGAGTFTLGYQLMPLLGTGLFLIVHSPEPRTPGADAVVLLDDNS